MNISQRYPSLPQRTGKNFGLIEDLDYLLNSIAREDGIDYGVALTNFVEESDMRLQPLAPTELGLTNVRKLAKAFIALAKQKKLEKAA